MVDSFVSLAALLRGANTAPAETPVPLENAAPPASAEFAHDDLIAELAVLRCAALEAFEHATARLLRAFADDVLARELHQSPADIQTLVGQALAQFTEHEPLEIALSASDAERVRAPLPVRVDATLGPGDLVVRVRDGAFESPFAFRVETALARCSPRSDA